jgi:hypothetical protein
MICGERRSTTHGRFPGAGKLAALAWLWCAGIGLAQPPHVTPTGEIEPLLRKLGSDRLRDRQEAERELLAAGPDVLDRLPPSDLIDDPAVRDAVRRIGVELERRLARESLQAGRVTYQGDATPEALARALTEQTGNQVDLSGLPPDVRGQSVSVTWTAVEFWSAIDDLARWTESRPMLRAGVSSVALVPAEGAEPVPLAVTNAGAFRLEVTEVTRRRGLNNGDKPHDLLRIDFRLLVEPRLRPLFADYRDAGFVVVAGTTRLPHFNPRASHQPDFKGSDGIAFSLDLLAPQGTNGEGLKGEGAIEVEVAAVPREIRLTGLSGPFPIERRRGGVTVSLGSVEPLPNRPAGDNSNTLVGTQIECVLGVKYDAGGPAFESHRLSSLYREAWIEDGAGTRLAVNDRLELRGERDGALTIAYRFSGLPESWREATLVYEAATGFVTTPVTFRFDVPVAP